MERAGHVLVFESGNFGTWLGKGLVDILGSWHQRNLRWFGFSNTSFTSFKAMRCPPSDFLPLILVSNE